MKRKFFNISLALVLLLSFCLVTAVPATASGPGTPITVSPDSYVKSGTYVYYVFGHYNSKLESVVVPGSGSAYSAHGWRNASGSEIKSTTAYTGTTAALPGEYQVGFDVTMNNWLYYGGFSDSYAHLPFTVTVDTDYDISGSYTTNANQGGIFRVYLMDLGTGTYVFNNGDALGTLNGPGLTGTLPPGDYQFEVFTRSHAYGAWYWVVPWGPISGGADQGTGSVHLGLTAQLNNPPVADAGPDQTVEQTSSAGTDVTLDGSGSTDDGQLNPLVYSWEWAGGSASGVGPTVSLPARDTTITLTVNDGQFIDTDSMTVTVEDTIAPEIEISIGATSIWPPNHKLVKVASVSGVSDAVDPSPSVVITVTHNQATNGSGDGNTAPDWQVDANGDISVRAERDGSGTDRVYTITITATDASGNNSVVTTTVTVPHDQRKK